MYKDGHSNITAVRAMAPATVTSATDTDGIVVDTLGYESCEFIVMCGTIAAGGVATFRIEESDVNTFGGEETVVGAVNAEELLGSISIDASSDDKPLRIGSAGKKRYQRLTMVTTTANSVEIENAVAILGHPENCPTAEQSS